MRSRRAPARTTRVVRGARTDSSFIRLQRTMGWTATIAPDHGDWSTSEPGPQGPVSAGHFPRRRGDQSAVRSGPRSPAAATRTALVREVLGRHGLGPTVHVTERAGHARELAAGAAADGADLVIVWGGDGTVNEAGSALVGSRTALGLVPAGSGNGLAASLVRAARVARGARAPAHRRRRAPSTSGSSAIGRSSTSPASVSTRTSPPSSIARTRGRRGKWPYLTIGVREGLRYRALDYEHRVRRPAAAR